MLGADVRLAIAVHEAVIASAACGAGTTTAVHAGLVTVHFVVTARGQPAPAGRASYVYG